MTDCVTGNCTIIDGSTTNGTYYIAGYDPNAPVCHWHQNMELATICVCNSLSFIVIVARIWYRWTRLKQLKADDRCIAIAGFFLIPYTASQIGTNVWGGGLHMINVPKSWLKWHWHYTPGWSGFYIVTSLIKISACLCFLDILPQHLKKMRYCAYGLCGLISCLGTTMTMSWIFECTPFLSNFLWSVDSTSCINYDYLRWLWIGFSVPIDLAILSIPWRLLKKIQLQHHERRILKSVFSATLLGTITCVVGIYGVWDDRTSAQVDSFYQETVFLMLNDIEIFMYTLGASFPVLSRYLVARSAPQQQTLESPNSNFSTWARHVPDFFFKANQTQAHQSHNRRTQHTSIHTEQGESGFGNPSDGSDTSGSVIQKCSEVHIRDSTRFDHDDYGIGDEESGKRM